jgi:hypothetical protein
MPDHAAPFLATAYGRQIYGRKRYIETERMAALIAWMPDVRVGNLVMDQRPPEAAALRAVLDKIANTNRVLFMRSRPLSGPSQRTKKDPGGDAGVLSYASTTEILADKADRLQPVQNLVGPEPLEPVQRLVEH